MSRPLDAPSDDEMRPEYDFRGGMRGKRYERYQRGTNLVRLEPDVAAVYPDTDSVNEALRLLMRVARRQEGPSAPSRT